ncbi:MAG TPA: hypothetical protein VGF70_03835 [Solirubrobacteraceae bacterium]|jgi:hypothetical protein
MELLEQDIGARAVVQPVLPGPVEPVVQPADELAARRSMRGQIARLERGLADAFVTAYPMGGLGDVTTSSYRDARMLTLGELERIRDELAERLGGARVTIAERAEIQDAHRLALERMLLDPAKYRFQRISSRDLGESGCGVWHVRPRLGLIGMLMGWWQVKLSSGCPLAGAAVCAAAR